MATAKSPGRQKREPGFPAEIGVRGRQTGLTLAERERDEHGLEIAEHLFSPTPGRPAPRLSNGTSNSSEEMDIASSGPDPSQLTGRPRTGKEILGAYGKQLPHMRSPLRSGLGGTPRRGSSIGFSSPGLQAQNLKEQPIRRTLQFPTGQGYLQPVAPPRTSSSGSKRVNNIYNLPSSEPDNTVLGGGGMDDDEGFMGGMDEPDDLGYDDEQEVNEYLNGQDEGEDLIDAGQEEEEDAVAPLPQSIKRKPGRPPKRPEVEVEVEQEAEPEVDQEDESQLEPEPDVHEVEPVKRGRGRPPKAAKDKAGALASKSTNTRLKPKAQPRLANKGDRKPQANQRKRHQTPMDDDEVSTSRAGRHIYKPLQYWKGEHAIFENHTLNTALKEIIRVDDATPVKRKRTYTGARPGRKRRNYSVFEEEIDDDGYEPWETADDGIVSAPVKLWDNEQELAPPDEEMEQMLAFAALKIQPHAMADNPNFMFTKTLTMPFFGGGLIELPPGGMKGEKNSRKFQFVFFVFVGKVAVEIAGTRFVISKGGMWQVPRGNFYSIANESDHTAKIFFAQGCEMPAQVEMPRLQSTD